MAKYNSKWNRDTILEDIRDGESQAEFRKRNETAWKRGVMLEIKEDMQKLFTKKMRKSRYSTEDAMIEALKYDSRTEFHDKARWAYKVLDSRDLLASACTHMPKHKTNINTVEIVTNKAKKYTRSGDFKHNDGTAYRYAIKHNILHTICEHMVDGEGTDADMVYLWRIPNTNIYKIGLSSVRLDDERIKRVASAMGVDYEVITMCEVKNAFEVETELHNTYQIVPTTLPKKDGHTEFRILTTSDVNEITYYLENVVGKKVTTKLHQ